MPPKYKLTYFDITGLGEPLRLLMSYGGLEFEDSRITQEDWPALKETINPPIRQLPILEFDGNLLFQSTAIARYLGTELGIAGENALENWEIDAVVDTLIDLRTKIFDWYIEQNETRKQEKKETVLKETVPFYMSKFDAWAKKNEGYLAIGKLTWADIAFVSTIDVLDEYCAKLNDKSFISGYSNLEALRDNIFSIPNIKVWLDNRPKPKL